jgi:PhzF family phenazine biosynthesis protein
MKITVHIVNAFIDGITGGNPAGVILDADTLNTEQKLKIAQKIGLSETAFVSKSDIATIKLEFFTPMRQIAHCGHATIATFSLLRQLCLIPSGQLSKETIDGNRAIIIDDDMAFMEQNQPQYTSISLTSELGKRIAHSLGLTAHHFLNDANPTIVNTGNSFLIIPLLNEETITALQPDFGAIESLSNELDLIGYYIFSQTTKIQGRHAGARMFAPRYGIREESGTGMAAGPLACFLHDKLNINQTEFLIEQGWLMQPPSPSIIKVMLNISENRIINLMAGGTARSQSTQIIEI